MEMTNRERLLFEYMTNSRGLSFKNWMIEEITTLRAELGRVAKDDWIPVAERLPEDGETVLVYSPWLEGQGERWDFDYCEDGVWQWHYDNWEQFMIAAKPTDCEVKGVSEQAPYTHWRPLPAPPTDSGRGEG